MDDLSLDSPRNGDDIKHAPKTPKKKQRKEKGSDATNDTKKKEKEKKKPVKSSKQQKKDKKGKAKPKIPASSSSSALSQTKSRPTTIISGSTCVGLSTREFSHQSAFDQDGDNASSSSSSSSSRSPATRPAVPLMASSPSSHLGSRASRGSMPQFASSPELLDLSSVRSRPKSSIIAPSAASSDPAVPAPAPATTKHSPSKEKNAHSSSGFDTTVKAPPSTRGAATTRSRSGSSECVMEGFLEEALLKRVGSTHTRRVSKWRKRWVRLFRCHAGTFLLTHDKPPAAGKKQTSVRSRIDVLAMVTTEKRDDVRRYAFVLMPDDCDRQPPSYFCADTEGARKSWMAAITRVQKQEVSDIVQPLRSLQQEPGKEKEESELRPGMTSLDFDDLAEDKRRKRTMVLVNGEEKREKVLDIQEEQDQISDEDSEEARMMRDIERRVHELQHSPQRPSGFGPSAPALSMSSVPAYYQPQQQLQIMQQHQHQQQQVLLRQQSYSVVGSHHHAPGATLSGSYNPFVEVPAAAAAVPQHHLQPQTSASYYMQPPVRRGSFVAADLSSSHSALPQAQTVVMSTLSAAAVSPSTSTSISSISPHGTPPAGMPVLPSPHIPPPFMRQSSSIHMAAAHHNSHHLLSSAPSAVAQS